MNQLHLRVMLAIFLTLTIKCQGQPSVKFTEEDYTSPINSGSVAVHITKLGISAGNITVKLSPLTFDNYMKLPILDCNSLEPQFTNYDPAEEGDFDSTPLEKTITPHTVGQFKTYSFNVPLTLDDIVEADEAFVIILEVIANEVVNTSRTCCIVTIRELPFNGTLVNFVRNGVVLTHNNSESIVLLEDAGLETLFTIEKAVVTEIPLRVTVRVQPYNLFSEGTDFEMLTESIDILEQDVSTDITIKILEDELAETTEEFTITIKVDAVGNSFSVQKRFRVEVQDNDVVTMGIKNSEAVIRITEGESAIIEYGLINFAKKNYTRYGVNLMISTMDGTAIEGHDYEKSVAMFQPFLPGKSSSIIMTIKQVGIEPERIFTFGFVEDSPLTRFEPRNIIIIIEDSSKLPLAPDIDSLSRKDSIIETIWTQEITEDRPVANFIVIIKACSSTPCEIKDPHVPKTDEIQYTVNNNIFELAADVDPSKPHAVVVCAVSSLGRSCSYSVIKDKDHDRIFDPDSAQGLQTTTPPAAVSPPIVAIGVVVLCVLLTILFFIIIVLIIIFMKRDRGLAYWPQKSKGKGLEGKSVDTGLEEDDIFEMKYF